MRVRCVLKTFEFTDCNTLCSYCGMHPQNCCQQLRLLANAGDDDDVDIVDLSNIIECNAVQCLCMCIVSAAMRAQKKENQQRE